MVGYLLQWVYLRRIPIGVLHFCDSAKPKNLTKFDSCSLQNVENHYEHKGGEP